MLDTYNARFERDDGKSFYFGYEYGAVFDISPLSELDVTVSTSQGFQQVGTTIENRSIGGVNRKISGVLLGDANDSKRRMLNIFAPFSSGKLIFNDKYYCNAVVKKTPYIATRSKDCEFTLQLYCASPYWLDMAESGYVLGGYTPAFHFPVNYATPHIFGIKNPNAFTNCKNTGDVDTLFAVEFSAESSVSNYGITNVYTLETMRFNDTLEYGERLRAYRIGGRLYVEKETESGTVDAFETLDESSNLFYIHPGDNIIKPDGDDATNLIVSVKFNAAYPGVYNGM